VAGLLPFPGDGLTWSWRGPDDERVHGSIRWENEGFTVEGTLGRDDATYVVRLSALFRVQQFLLFRDLEEPDLWLARDRHGRWGEVNGAHRPDLDGCDFVDLARTPLTNSLVVRALPLAHPDAALVPVAAIDVETLSVEPRTVRYERTGESSWRYDSLLVGATVAADVDAHGVVTNESVGFQRINE
jgi:hypothetical protein